MLAAAAVGVCSCAQETYYKKTIEIKQQYRKKKGVNQDTLFYKQYQYTDSTANRNG